MRRPVSRSWSRPCTSAPGSGRSFWWTNTTSRSALGDRELALANRGFLRDLYGAIKDCDEQLRFVFLTGVTKLAGLFSGLNNLRDITLAPEFSDICGYTDAELDAVFAPELEGLDRDEIRRWYNGYNWLGPERLYNPFGVLLLLAERRFGNYWFESGTPTFLVETLTRRGLPTPDLDGMTGSEALLSTFDVDRISTEALLFQTGYLTIAGEEDGGRRYRLGYPNLEVRQSLGEALLGELLPDEARKKTEDPQLRELLEANDFERLKALFRGVFAAIPHQWHMSSPVARYEAHYASVLLLLDARPRAGRGGQRQPGARRHGDTRRRARLPVRVQGGGARAGRNCNCAAAGEGLRGQVPPSRAFGSSGGVQPRGAQRRRVARPPETASRSDASRAFRPRRMRGLAAVSAGSPPCAPAA